jgi:regulator of RNase E activity RraA
MSATELPENYTFEQLRTTLSVAVVCDSLDSAGYRNQSPRFDWPVRTVEGTLVGRCRTTLWGNLFHPDPNPYELELKAVDACKPGDVLIAAAGGSVRSGIWGELLSTAARNSGCLGAVIDGAVRDIAPMSRMGFSVFARGSIPYDSKDRQRVVDIDVPVEIDGITVCSGDLVLADRDGVVFVPAGIERPVLEAAWKKVHAENQVRDSIRQGMKAADAYARYGVL